jgi:N-acetyl sugar amidotransferase
MSTRPRITFDNNGICNACQWRDEKKILDWSKRITELKSIIRQKKNNQVYDCIVPVSGGKDGAYVAYKLKEELGLNVLTVTSRPPLESDIGKKNLINFVNSGFDHIHITPDQNGMKTLNKLGFIKKGSPYYGWLISIFSVVIRIAIQNNINLIFYGEDGEIEYGGSTQNKNKALFDINYMIKNYFEGDYEQIKKESRLTDKELFWFNVSGEKQSEFNNISLTHWGYFEPWDSYRNYIFGKEKYKLSESESANEGTFTNFAQNDQALFALHMYLMYLKFGFGRATQDAGIEIRRGAMSRSQAINLAKLYDNNYPENFIELYLNYYEMKLSEFEEVLDKFANKNLFEKISGRWSPKFEIK